MPRTCTICSHESRHEIDSALVSGTVSLRDIARQYRVSRTALSRHINNGHIAKKIQKAARAHEAVEADKFLSRIEKYQGHFETLVERAQKMKDFEWEIKALHGLKEYLELEGKAIGAFKEKRENTGSLTIRFDNEDQNL